MRDVEVHPHGTRALSASNDQTVRVWDLTTGACQQTLEGHTSSVRDVEVHPNGTRALRASNDQTVRVWELSTGACQQILEGHTGPVLGVAVHPDGTRALSASADRTVRVWDFTTGACQQTLEGHASAVRDVEVHPHGTRALSASADQTVRVWDLTTGACQQILEGHTSAVLGVAVHPDGTRALSASADRTVRVWDLATGACQQTFEGRVLGVAVRPDGRTFVWRVENGVLEMWSVAVLAPTDAAAAEAAVYTNAKVVLVGESQAGKSGLALRLAHDRWERTDSTTGAWATQLRLAPDGPTDDGADREIWLWDFGGQADQRLIHQLYLGDVALAVLVFDGQRDDAMTRLWDWSRALASAAGDAPKLLAAGRTDTNAVRLARSQLNEFRSSAGFAGYVETSARDDVGCRELREEIVRTIDWSRVPHRSSPIVFKRLKDEIIALRDGGRALTTVKELRDLLPARVGDFEPEQLDAVIGLLAGPGAVLRLDFGDYVLLRPELLNAYAQAVIRSLRDEPRQRGCIAEERVLAGDDLSYPEDFERLPDGEEHVVLHAMHRQLVARSICLRDHDPEGKRATILVFPSYFRRERDDRPGRPQSFMTYRFAGYLDEIYAALVVRLHHSQPLRSGEMWRGAADFRTADGSQVGIRLTTRPDGAGELELHCERGTSATEQVLFAGYVHEHLRGAAPDVVRLRTYICAACGTSVENRDAALRRLQEGRPDIACSYCDARIELWDDVEQALSSDEVRERVEGMLARAQEAQDSESRERLLVGEVMAAVARAGQLARESPTSDHGIDMEIEFKHDDGRASARKLYLQLKSGDSHLRDRKRDASRVFAIRKERHADYWADQAFPVWLVVRDSAGTIEWMRIDEHLRAKRDAGRWPAREIIFDGERFDVMSIRRRRAEALGLDHP
ncbi:MAG: DUF4365 domain-containing protein [Solirubrobacteraceae bacterium]